MGKYHKKDVGVRLRKGQARFCVWAPFAEAVAVCGTFNSWARTELASEGDGYWSGTVKKVRPGHEYKYVITRNNKEVFKNDPRALQLTTTAGNSVIADPNFTWSDDTFVAPPVNSLILYEMHIGTFNRVDASTNGTFENAIQKLDYLADLGVNAIELMPIGSMTMDRGWGYAISYMYAVESLYGARHEFLQFVDAAHQRGISVILDVVYNHFGPGDDLDMWQFDGWNEHGKGGIYFYNDWRSETPWGDVRPDYGRHEVRQYIVDNVRMWLQDCHIDGLRLDSTIYMRNVKGRDNDPEHDIPEAWTLMQEINDVARKIKPNSLLIAEDVAYNEYITKPSSVGGAGFGAQWELNFPRALRDALDTVKDENRNLSSLCDQLVRSYNGDVFQRVIYSDSHDSAANGGARLSEEISPGNPDSLYARRRSLLAATVTLTAPGIPMLLQGQEFMQGGSFSDWQALEWDKAEHFAGVVLAHKHLLSLRKNLYGNSAGLTGQSLAILRCDDQSKLLAYHRWDQGGPRDDVVVVINLTNKTVSDYMLNFPRDGTWTLRFNSGWVGYAADFKRGESTDVEVSNGMGTVKVGPYSAIILSQD